MKAFLAVHGTQGAASASVRETVDGLTEAVVRALLRSRPGGGTFHIEDVQDQVELGLMRGGHHEVARAYVLYRERRAQERAKQGRAGGAERAGAARARRRPARAARPARACKRLVESACAGPGRRRQAPTPILAETMRNLYDGVPIDEVYKAAILAARTLIEKDPAYTYATARLLLHTIRQEILGERGAAGRDGARATPTTSRASSRRASTPSCSTRSCCSSTWRSWARRSRPSATCSSTTSACRPCTTATSCTCDEARIELPQAFFMRVAMGLALNEIDREARAIEFYEVLSSFDFMSSTPTLFNAGTLRSQLSTCYLTTVPDDLDGIYEAIKENALLSKFAGGLGNDWTPRARARLPHQGHQRQEPGRRAVPEGRQRHRRGGQPGRQAQGRGLRLPGDLAPGHRGVPRAAQEHRRRPPPHARHEHGQLDPRPVHEAGDGRRRLDAVLALRRARPARQVRQGLRGGLRRPTRRRPARGEIKLCKTHAGHATCGARCCRCCSRPGIPGSPSRTPATCARRSSTSAWCTPPTCAPRSR